MYEIRSSERGTTWSNSNTFAEQKQWKFFLINLFYSNLGFIILEHICTEKDKLHILDM